MQPFRFLRSLLPLVAFGVASVAVFGQVPGEGPGELTAVMPKYECEHYTGMNVHEFMTRMSLHNMKPVFYESALGLPVEQPDDDYRVIGNHPLSLPGDPKDPGEEVGVIIIEPFKRITTKLLVVALISILVSVTISMTLAKGMIASAIKGLKDWVGEVLSKGSGGGG